MIVGDLVSVTQERGIGHYAHQVPRGVGIVINIAEPEKMMFGNIGPIEILRMVTVLLSTGELDEFCIESVEVISNEPG